MPKTEVQNRVAEELLGFVFEQFYRDDSRAYFQQRPVLLDAVTYPARWFDERGVRVNAERYQEIVLKILGTIRQHGDLRSIRFFCRYLLHSVQEHMKHHGEEYYEEAKSLRSLVFDVKAGLRPAPRDSGKLQTDDTVPILSQVNRVVAGGKPGRKKKTAAKRAAQLDLC